MCHKALVFIVILSMFLLSPTWGQSGEELEPQGERTLTIIHSSYLQRHIMDELEGGFGIADVSAVVDYVNREGSPLVLGTGGLGTAPAGVDLHDEHSGLYARVLEATGYDAVVPGSSDFANGLDPLITFDKEAAFPLLCANLLIDGKNPFTGSALFDIEGMKVGVLALLSPEVEEILARGSLEGKENARELELKDPLQTVEREVEKLRQSGAEVIIGVTDIPLVNLYESGYFGDEELDGAGAALSGDIDLVIEGSEASTAEEPLRLGGTVFTSAAESGSIGGVDILVRGGEVAEIRTRMIGPDVVEEAGLDPMPGVVSLLDQLSVALREKDTEKTAQATETDASEETVTQPEEQERRDEMQEEDTEEEEPQPTEERTLPQLELFLEPGLSLYSGAVGYGGSIGVMSYLYELFGLGSPFDDVVLGLLLRYEGLRTSSPELKLNAWGPAVFGGYRFLLDDYFPEAGFFTDSRLLLRLTAGGMSLKIERDGENTYAKFSPLLAPGVVIDKELPILDGLRAGISGEYTMTFADSVLGNFRIGAFALWTY